MIHDGKGVFLGMPDKFQATRYHSLVGTAQTLPSCLEVSAKTENGLIMGIRHKTIPCLEGVQFHPESIVTEEGKRLIKNFLEMKIA